MRHAYSRVVLGVALAASLAGCSSEELGRPRPRAETTPRAPGFVHAPAGVLAACRKTARAVGYRVPCPTRSPAGTEPTGAVGPTGCALSLIGPGGIGGCARSWRGWVVGSSWSVDGHLVIAGSPKPLRSDAKIVDGPAWYPGASVTPLGRVVVAGRTMHAVFVPAATNDGSAFMHHVVLIWTVGRHPYAIGFHDLTGVRATLGLDERLARSVRLVGP